MIFEAGWPIVGVGLDVTHTVTLSEARREELNASGTAAGQHLYRITQFSLEHYVRRTGRRECTMHDALKLAIAADPSLATRAYRTRVDVEPARTHTRGMTVADFRQVQYPSPTPPHDANADVVLAVDGSRFLDRFMQALCT